MKRQETQREANVKKWEALDDIKYTNNAESYIYRTPNNNNAYIISYL